MPWLALPDIRRLDCREAHETLERTNADGLANSSARMLPPGTVCLSRTASVGFVTILGREMGCIRSVMGLHRCCSGRRNARQARDLQTGRQPFEVALLLWREVAGHFVLCRFCGCE